MKSYSTSDLQLIPELSHLRMLDFINPDYDNLIAPYLKVLGYDLDFPVQFVAAQHRNLQGKVVIGYIIIGETECNDSFLSSAFASHEDRMIAAGYRDLSFASDIAQQFTSCREYGDTTDGFPPDQANPDEKEILKQIRVLEDLLFIARGDPHKNDGSLKLYGESNVVEAPEKRRKKPEQYKKPLAKV